MGSLQLPDNLPGERRSSLAGAALADLRRGRGMSFQTDDLSLLTLGIQGDTPPDADQPPLRNGSANRFWMPKSS